MKISLREITCANQHPMNGPSAAKKSTPPSQKKTYILMLQVLQKLQFSVCSLRQDGGTERLHDLLNRNILASQLILGGAAQTHQYSPTTPIARRGTLPNETEGSHPNRLEIRIPTPRSVLRRERVVCHRVNPSVPGCNLEGGAEDLRAYEFRHG